MIALAAVQQLEHEHQATLAPPSAQPAEVQANQPDVTAARGFDDPQRREQLRTRLAVTGVAREAAEAAHTPVAAAPAPPTASGRSTSRELRRQR